MKPLCVEASRSHQLEDGEGLGGSSEGESPDCSARTPDVPPWLQAPFLLFDCLSLYHHQDFLASVGLIRMRRVPAKDQAGNGIRSRLTDLAPSVPGIVRLFLTPELPGAVLAVVVAAPRVPWIKLGAMRLLCNNEGQSS